LKLSSRSACPEKILFRETARDLAFKNRFTLMNEDSLIAVKTEKEHVGDVRFAHEKMRAKIGTDNSPHVCPVFRVKGRNFNQDLFRANGRSPLQENCTVILNCHRVEPP
ncbi:MAG: hypothetical protein PHX36_08600, partial [Mesotoga sp.]|uniref:hypothetical protein n=1 Tax=Mesotoga sp. TaxID=2053577 RepID=UPI0026388FEA